MTLNITWLRQPTGDEETVGKFRPTEAVVRWVAAGHVDTKAALADPSFPVRFNDPHPDYGSGDKRRALQPRIIATGYRVHTVEARYAIPPNDTNEHQPEEPDQTNPLVYAWQTVQETVAIDRDRAGNAILTAAYRGVQGLTRTLNYKRLTITRWQAAYNNNQAMAYENTVNSTSWEGAAAGEVKCVIIQPSSSYTAESALLPIDHVFDFKAKTIWGDHPHQTVFLHRDSYALGQTDSGNQMLRIVTASGELVSDTPLDAQGRPVEPSLTYFITNPNYDPDDPENNEKIIPNPSPTWVATDLPAGATAEAAGTGNLVRLRYMTLPEVDYNALGL